MSDETEAIERPAEDELAAEDQPVHNHLKLDITNLVAHAEELRNAAGHSPEGRLLSIVCTDLQKVQAFVGYNAL